MYRRATMIGEEFREEHWRERVPVTGMHRGRRSRFFFLWPGLRPLWMFVVNGRKHYGAT
jgi:hypothetical protein